jgi:Ca-activated chloride channel family protein
VRQVFENHTGTIQEGTWRFTLPPSGAVGDFAVWDGNVRIPGVILEKRRARAIYRELTTQRIDPGLLQQGEEEDREPGASEDAAPRPSGGAAFSVKVAPIPAWGTKRLEMQYQHEVPWLDGVGELRLPLSPGGGAAAPVAGTFEVRVTLLDGDFTAPVAGTLELSRKGRVATFTGTRVPLSRDIVLRFRPASTAPLAFTAFRNLAGTPPDGLALAPWERPSDLPRDRDGFFLLEYRPEAKDAAAGPGKAKPERRGPAAVAVLFDTTHSHRWGGLAEQPLGAHETDLELVAMCGCGR